ncbi:hypothetical protein DKY63_00400 [Pseudomonas putida]|uniref:Uncharacterized protein n=1 Tax=Pseudomonas putida TaxID=303 RepID=A0A2Z4RCE1_PSEPU|nr:hypothetical protein DKY63_00400 [Pseudomonas putida]
MKNLDGKRAMAVEDCCWRPCFLSLSEVHHQPPVGAGLLAMVVNDNVGSLTPRGVLSFIASRLAPTGIFAPI